MGCCGAKRNASNGRSNRGSANTRTAARLVNTRAAVFLRSLTAYQGWSYVSLMSASNDLVGQLLGLDVPESPFLSSAASLDMLHFADQLLPSGHVRLVRLNNESYDDRAGRARSALDSELVSGASRRFSFFRFSST